MDKKALTPSEQISILESRGMIFDNKAKAEEILSDIGYYRFGFFSFPFEKTYPNKTKRTHELKAGTTFKQVYDLYAFDSQLRFILTKALTRIEINIRTRLTLMGSLHYISDPCWFCNPSYINTSFISKFNREVYSAVKKNPAIQEHHKNHPNDKYAPAWKTMEFMTLGNVLFLYEAIKDEELKAAVAKHYGCSIKVFLNYLETIRIIRNRCAHGGCLYNINIDKGIKRVPAMVENADSHNIKGAIKVILYLISKISLRQKREVTNEINDEILKLNKNPETQYVIKLCSNINEIFQ